MISTIILILLCTSCGVIIFLSVMTVIYFNTLKQKTIDFFDSIFSPISKAFKPVTDAWDSLQNSITSTIEGTESKIINMQNSVGDKIANALTIK